MQGDDLGVFDLGVRLAELRKTKNLTQSDLARKLGLHRNTINGYEANTLTPSVEVLKKLAIFFNVSIDYILGFENRSYLYIDDLTEKQQEFMLEILKMFKNMFQESN